MSRLFDKLLPILIFFISNRRAWYCFFVEDDTYHYCEYGDITSDYLVWGMILAGIVFILFRRGRFHDFVHAWQDNWLLAIFLFYSVISIIWSTVPVQSLHSVFIFFAASLAAAYLAVVYRIDRLMEYLVFVLSITAILSLLTVIFLPNTAIMHNLGLDGSWRGVFVHKNYLGSVMAFGNALFLLSLWQIHSTFRERFFYGTLYLLTLFLVVMSDSATGLLLVVILNSLFFLYLAWAGWRNRLKQKHYVFISSVFISFILFFFWKLNVILSLVGRSSGLTGRVPLWSYLLTNIIVQKPWFGYGLETIWYSDEFRRAAGRAAGWGIWIINSHSGYMDILVYLGIFGLGIFSLILVQGCARSIKMALAQPSAEAFLPLLVLTYVLVTNITISYYVEFESFHWVLLVLSIFLATLYLKPRLFKENTPEKSSGLK